MINIFTTITLQMNQIVMETQKQFLSKKGVITEDSILNGLDEKGLPKNHCVKVNN